MHKPRYGSRGKASVASYYPRGRQAIPYQLTRDNLAQLNQPTPAEASPGEPTPAAPEPAAHTPIDASAPAPADSAGTLTERLPQAAEPAPAQNETDGESAGPSLSGEELPQPEAENADAQPEPIAAPGGDAIEPLPMNEALLHPGPSPLTCSSGCWLDCGSWYTQDDFVYMARQGPAKDRTLAFANSGILDPALLRTTRTLGYAPGGRFTVGRWLCRDNRNRDHAVEFTYFGFLDWEDSRGLETFFGDRIFSALDITVPGFNFADKQRYEYRSELNSFEANLRINRRLGRDRLELNPKGYWVRKCSPAPLCSLFAGARYLTLDERFDYFSEGDPFTSAPNNQGEVLTRSDIRGSFQTSTQNDLLGLQAGSDIWFQHCRWRTGVRVKGGPFINFANQSTRVLANTTNTTTTPAEDPDDPPIVSDPQSDDINRNEKATKNVASFVGEVSLMGQYQLRRNFALRASYDLMWVNQVALGLDQVSFIQRTPPDIKTGGSLFMQGFSLGAEYVW